MSLSDAQLFSCMQRNFMVSPATIVDGRRALHTLVTSFFSHMETYHLLSNMITLYFFGSSAVMHLGASRFLALYMTGGVVSNIAYCVWPYLPQMRGNHTRRSYGNNPKYDSALGASGAVSSIVMWSICTYPRQTVLVYFLPMPAALVGILFVGKDIYDLNQPGGRVANIAHLGGAALGVAYYLLRRFR